MIIRVLLPGLVATLTAGSPAQARAAEDLVNGYRPVAGGCEIRISDDASASRLAAGLRLGGVEGDARRHRRPLYPPGDKTLVWTADDLAKLERIGFRPLVLAYNEPRFLFDFHSAGGLLGHLQAGLTTAGASKWFHQWSDLTVRYANGRMEYTLGDAAFPGVVVKLLALPLADSAGLILQVAVSGLKGPASLVWAYGGASAFFTNYKMDAPEFHFAPSHCAKDAISWDAHGFALRRAFDESDVYVKQFFAAPRYLTNWQAVIRGGASWAGQTGFGAPEAFTNSPAALAQTLEPAGTAGGVGKRYCVAVQSVALREAAAEGFIVIGMGGAIVENLSAPGLAWRAAQSRQETIARRIRTRTPDAQLDAAVRMMAFATLLGVRKSAPTARPGRPTASRFTRARPARTWASSRWRADIRRALIFRSRPPGRRFT